MSDTNRVPHRGPVFTRRTALKLVAAGSVGALQLLAACAAPTAQQKPGPTAGPPAPAATTGTTAAPTLGAQPERSRMGGTARVALYSEPPTLDSTWTTAILVVVPSQHVFEYLFAYDGKWDSKPMLADRLEIADGGKRYTFTLRKGVRFHNGKELTAEDVVASLNRWGKLSSEGKSVYQRVESVTAVDPLTVRLQLSAPFAALRNYLTGPTGAGAIIMPKEIADAAGTERLTQYVGTGPYKFVEHVPDRHVKLVRFEQYAPRSEPADAYSGRRTAYFDELLFIPVPDAAARIAGVETGNYHWAEEVTRDEYARLKDSRDVETIVIKPLRWQGVIFNKKQGPMADVRLRQAVLHALDKKEIMAAAFGPPDFWRLEHSLLPPESVWHSDAGKNVYDTRNLDRARQLVQESGYRGEKIRWMGPADREDYFAVAVTGVQQLKAIGLDAEVVSMDWGALVQQRTKPEVYEIFNTGFTFEPEPTVLSFIGEGWPGWWVSDRKRELLGKLADESDFTKRKALWDQFQQLVYDEAPVVKLGDFFGLTIKRRELKGEKIPISSYPAFWNQWIEK